MGAEIKKKNKKNVGQVKHESLGEGEEALGREMWKIVSKTNPWPIIIN